MSLVRFPVQEKQNKKLEPAIRGQINFPRIKTDGSRIFLVRLVANREKKPLKKTRTVLVPIKTDKGIEHREEHQTYLEPAMDEELVPLPKNYSFIDLTGKTLSQKEVLSRLGMGPDGKLVVMLFANQKIPQAYQQLLNKKTIFIQPRTNGSQSQLGPGRKKK